MGIPLFRALKDLEIDALQIQVEKLTRDYNELLKERNLLIDSINSKVITDSMMPS